VTTPAQIKNQARTLRDRAHELRLEDPGANTLTQVVADLAGALADLAEQLEGHGGEKFQVSGSLDT
jgi:uncharacterized protein YukE